MHNWKFYHGTSQEAYNSIKVNGFVLTEPRRHNFLASQGVYLVPNRPLIARRFAKQAGRADFSDQFVIQVCIKRSRSIRILDLTTDKGMQRFYKAYIEVQQAFALNKGSKLGSNIPPTHEQYLNSVKEANDSVIHKLNEAINVFHEDSQRFNWDTVALDRIVDLDKIQLIIGSIREGDTFNFIYFAHKLQNKQAPYHLGIGVRDHIEACVTDLSIIDYDRLTERPYTKDTREFDNDYICCVTNIDSRDVPP